jgi:hypothetical protein
MTRRRKIYLAALTTSLGTLGVMIAGSGSSAGDPSLDHSRILNDTPAHYGTDALSTRLTQRFGVLRRPATADDKLPRNALEVSASYGSIPAAARRARDTAHGPLFVIPGAQERLCLMDQNGAGSCNALTATGDLLLMTSMDHAPGLAAGQVEIQGVVPDGVASVTVTLRGGGERKLRVVNNVFEGVLPSGPARVLLDNGHLLDAPWMS